MSEVTFKNCVVNWDNFLREKIKQFDGQLAGLDDGDIVQSIESEKLKITRQLEVLENVKNGIVTSPKLFLELINFKTLVHNNIKEFNNKFFNKGLNSSQKHAVENAICSSNQITLIQGPPGTGKTTVITEICRQLFADNPNIRILITSETHVAVNNVLENLKNYYSEFQILRVGNKEDGLDYKTPEEIVLSSLQFLYDTGTITLEVGDHLFKILTGSSRSKTLEVDLINSLNFVGMTCNKVAAYNFSANSFNLDLNIDFDYVIIDEAAKATFPELLAPLTKAKKAIIVGDPNQLPPMFCQEEIELQKTLETDLQNQNYVDQLFLNRNITTLLEYQFRMPNKIGDIISSKFYEDKLKNGLNRPEADCLYWIDYDNNIPANRWPKKPKEILNIKEVELILLTIEKFYLKPKETIIISPYRKQIAEIQKALKKEGMNGFSVNTIDAIQGRDSENVIFSITRSIGSQRFFSDPRRLNVSLSRVKQKLFIVGSSNYSKTVSSLHSFFEAAIKINF